MTRQVLLATAALLALASGPLPGGEIRVGDAPEEWLAGRWQARFDLDTAWQLAEPVRTRQLRGALRFDPVPPVPGGAPAERPVHAGVFAVDFVQFGFRSQSTEALGWYDGPANVRIVLNPVVDHGVIELVGMRVGDSVAGQWT
ncbi:MAG: hypothetical protein ACREOF_12680, partial [Gemmatimonadales bacterium]